VIRGVYWPFLAEWLAAFGEQLLVLRAEDMLDAPRTHRPRLLSFLGLPPVTESSVGDGPPSYATMHAASLQFYGAKPMLNTTRTMLEAFYAPHTHRLAVLLSWDVDTWRASTRLTAAHHAQGATIRYRRYGPYYPDNQATRYLIRSSAASTSRPRSAAGRALGGGRVVKAKVRPKRGLHL